MKIVKKPSILALPAAAMAAALCTSGATAGEPCNSVLLYDNGFPPGCFAVASRIDDPVDFQANFLSADDFVIEEDFEINDVHVYFIEGPNLLWDGDLHLEIWSHDAVNCLPLAQLVNEDHGTNFATTGIVTRTDLGPEPTFAGVNRVRYDLTGISVPLSAGTYWISVAPYLAMDNADPSFWTSTRCEQNGDFILGCGAVQDADAAAYTWATVFSDDADTQRIDLNFQLTTCAVGGGGAGCLGDACGSCDGEVDVFDILEALGNFGATQPGCGTLCTDGNCLVGDANGDCEVDVFDILDILAEFGTCAGGSANNDALENATLIPGGGTYDFDLTGATPDGPAGNTCDPALPGDLPDVWFCLKAECDGIVTIQLSENLPVIVYESAGGLGCEGELGAEIRCDDDGQLVSEEEAIDVEEGAHYVIRILGNAGVGTITVDCLPQPLDNRVCAQARPLQLGEPTTQSTDPDGPLAVGIDCGNVDGSPFTAGGRYYTITNDTGLDSVFQASVCGANDYNSAIVVYCGDCTDLICVGGEGQSCGDDGEVFWCADAEDSQGNPIEYTILVVGQVGEHGTHTITVNNVSPGDCAGLPVEEACDPISPPVCVLCAGSTPEDGCEGDPGTANCQLPTYAGDDNTGTIGTASVINSAADFIVADDFHPTANDNVTQVCWWGIWNGPAGDAGPGDAENFRIRIYQDDGAGLPGAQLVEANVSVSGGTADRSFQGDFITVGGGATFNVFEYTAAIPSTAVTSDNCYWLEVVADVQASVIGVRFFLTMSEGNNRRVQDDTTGYGPEDVLFDDVNFCVDVEFDTNQPCVGPPPPPANDECVDREALVIGAPDTQGPAIDFATADPNTFFCDGVPGGQPGVWYSVIGDGNTLTASLCNSPNNFDSIIHVYCELDGDCADLACVAAGDDECGVPGQGADAEVSWCSTNGQEYYLFVADFTGAGASGDFLINVTTDNVGCVADAGQCEPGEFVCDCPVGSDLEGEACITDVANDINGGCNHPTDQFGAIVVNGPSVCGVASTITGGGRDTDWYAFNIPASAQVTLEFIGDFNGLFGIVCNPTNDITNCSGALAFCDDNGAVVTGPGCIPASTTFTGQGTFAAFASTANFGTTADDTNCDGSGDPGDYVLTLTSP